MTDALRKKVGTKPSGDETFIEMTVDEIGRATRAFFAPIIGARMVIQELVTRDSREAASKTERHKGETQA